MAVVILNVSENYGRPYGVGEQLYELKINSKVLVTFKHKFEDGLAECLRKAADTFELSEEDDNSKT